MSTLRRILRALVPSPLRASIKNAHRRIVFQRAMRRFLNDPTSCLDPHSKTVKELIYGWGNEAWGASGEYIAVCIRYALELQGPVLECGSGLSTLLVGSIAERRGQSHWALENSTEWCRRVREALASWSLRSVHVIEAPLVEYDGFAWYDAPGAELPESFALVLADGPPGDTEGGRYGLVPVMKDHLKSGSVILLDDCGREEDLEVARRWESELDVTSELHGKKIPYKVITLN